MKLFVFIVFAFFFSGFTVAQQTNYVDFKKIEANVLFDYTDIENVNIFKYKATFDVLKRTDSIFLDAKDMTFYDVYLNNKPIEIHNTGKHLVLKEKFKKSKNNVLSFAAEVRPKKAMYFVSKEGDTIDQVWTQGQGKYTSHWLPSIDDVNDKIIFNLVISSTPGTKAIGNGKLVNYIDDGFVEHWFYEMNRPMSSYLVALAMGQYDKKTELSKSGIPLEYYYYPEDSLNVEPTYRYTKEMFDFLEEEIGFSYPWQNYKQVPVKDFLYSGMENASLTIFSDSYVVDSIAFNDKNYITVNAHELAHQWFGNLVTAKSGEHHWLQEGFATYYALLAERHLFGGEHYYWQLFENAQELLAQESRGEGTSLLNPKSSSTTFYKKGAWVLHMLREQVGDSAFKSAVRAYLSAYQFGSVETKDFISEVERASGQDLSEFVDSWLVNVDLPEDAMVKSLKKSSFMNDYLNVNCEERPSECKDVLVSYVSDEIKIKVVAQLPEQIDTHAFKNSLKVRQAIAQYVSTIPSQLKSDYESLLDDKSYLTKEVALYNLWVSFPQERVKYLEKTKDVKGFNNYNVRLLWLALHLNTLEYQPEKKQQILKELISYSLPNQLFELRMNAFNYLKLLDAFDKQSIESLVEASRHYNWRFSKFAKTMLEELQRKEAYKNLIELYKKE
ncbi:M1 family metallopeptidase [Psychroserpens sp. BH13MA-6]